jgi:hypothetical protein
MAITGANTPIRVVCNNTLNMALAGAKQTFKLRHTQNAAERAKVISEALAINHGYIDRLEEVANDLMAKKISDQMFWDIVTTAYPKPEKEVGRGATVWNKKVDNLIGLRSAPTNSMHADNAWGALNVLLEDLDWFRTGRGKNADENLASARAGFDPIVNSTRNKFLSIVQEKVAA